MDKKTKGCLTVGVVFILTLITITFFVIDTIDKSFQISKNKVDTSWDKYINILHDRNRTLEKVGNKSLLPLITKTERNLETNSSKKELITIEYIINDSLRKYRYADSFNKRLNNCLMNYNVNVKEFNNKYSSFPYNYLRIKKSVQLYDHFEIKYGSDNGDIIRKNDKIDDWIENGGELHIE